jgi:hypothetical protein
MKESFQKIKLKKNTTEAQRHCRLCATKSRFLRFQEMILVAFRQFNWREAGRMQQAAGSKSLGNSSAL